MGINALFSYYLVIYLIVCLFDLIYYPAHTARAGKVIHIQCRERVWNNSPKNIFSNIMKSSSPIISSDH